MMMDADGAAVEEVVGCAVAGFLIVGGMAATLGRGVGVGAGATLVVAGGGAVTTADAVADAGGAVAATGGGVGACRGDENVIPAKIDPASSTTPPAAIAYGTHFFFGGRTRAIKSEPVIGPSVSASGRAWRPLRDDCGLLVIFDKLEKLGVLGGTPPIKRWMRSM